MAFSFFSLLLAPVQCVDKTFLNLNFTQSRKILSKFLKTSPIVKRREKNFVMMTPVVRLSARTNQNARKTWVIIYKLNR